MESLFRYTAAPSRCGYLPDQLWSLEYEYVASMTEAEYLQRMLEGWRRFGTMLFRPVCPRCTACRAIRIVADQFRPDRSQRRVRKANEGEITLRIGTPSVSRIKLALYDRYHAYQADAKGWPEHDPKDPRSYADSFVHHPFPVEEWCYYRGNRLIGVGYVDHLPDPPASPDGLPGEAGVQGLSAIYFFYDPDERRRSPGTWNVLCLIDEAVRRKLPYVYLGYYVAGCPSMEYKPRFMPNQIRGADGEWREFRA
jgi:arginine-tRNA-protein transferase